MQKAKGYAAHNQKDPLVPFDFERRDVGPHDVQMNILYCGICHSDLHTVRNEWKGTTYPVVPGHVHVSLCLVFVAVLIFLSFHQNQIRLNDQLQFLFL
ncbi:putative zinc-type alcohol dehydrogenase-like protein YahK [Candidatus Rubidus massiliensis]|nr:putative zinc-type alcohol dehydrogenase-like protein YahK [Candidatus Rubidus massiliensis]